VAGTLTALVEAPLVVADIGLFTGTGALLNGSTGDAEGPVSVLLQTLDSAANDLASKPPAESASSPVDAEAAASTGSTKSGAKSALATSASTGTAPRIGTTTLTQGVTQPAGERTAQKSAASTATGATHGIHAGAAQNAKK